ncbi:MAG: GxxExxY protein [Verrucomicrobia bacterium]|nr:GxxExxY protein [Verrucomicrobiota bacterium]
MLAVDSFSQYRLAQRRRGAEITAEMNENVIGTEVLKAEINEGFRADIVVDKKVLLELKSVEHVIPAHKKQVQTYLRLTRLKLGYLLNFGEAVLKNRITRCVNGLDQEFSAPPRLCGKMPNHHDLAT